jgi:hypothetical protein
MYNVSTLFVVFHEKIFDECYDDIPREMSLDKYFTFVAVNPNIPKDLH